MKKSALLFPVTLVVGAVSAVVGAVLFARNKKVRNFVKDSSGKLLEELKKGVSTAKEKLDESKMNPDDKVGNFLKTTVADISKRLEQTDPKQLAESLDKLAAKIEETIVKVEEAKETSIDPKVKQALESLKEIKTKMNQK